MAYFLDTNIFLRFLTADDARKAAACRKLIRRGMEGEVELATHPLILAEVVWVLESYYELPRQEIAQKLDLIMNTPNLVVADAGPFSRAIELYLGSNLDLTDCFSASLSMTDGSTLVSYDRDFDAIDGVTRKEPSQIG